MPSSVRFRHCRIATEVGEEENVSTSREPFTCRFGTGECFIALYSSFQASVTSLRPLSFALLRRPFIGILQAAHWPRSRFTSAGLGIHAFDSSADPHLVLSTFTARTRAAALRGARPPT